MSLTSLFPTAKIARKRGVRLPLPSRGDMNARKLTALPVLLLATTALSRIALADPVVYDWSGFYLGAHAGYGEAKVSGLFEGAPGQDFEDFGG